MVPHLCKYFLFAYIDKTLYLFILLFKLSYSEEKETALTKLNDIEEGTELPINSEEVSSEPSTPLAPAEDTTNAVVVPSIPTSTSTDEFIWPSIGDLNNRVRRLISTCQRNFKKEEQKLVQKAKVSIVIIILSSI